VTGSYFSLLFPLVLLVIASSTFSTVFSVKLWLIKSTNNRHPTKGRRWFSETTQKKLDQVMFLNQHLHFESTQNLGITQLDYKE